jgi:hypothetical protein
MAYLNAVFKHLLARKMGNRQVVHGVEIEVGPS